jgi:PAS domain S-box-containing protein
LFFQDATAKHKPLFSFDIYTNCLPLIQADEDGDFVMENSNETEFVILLDQCGQLNGMTNHIDNQSEQDINQLWQEVLPAISLQDGFMIEHKNKSRSWMIEIKEVHNDGQSLYFMAIFNALNDSGKRFKSNRVAKLESKLAFYEKIINNSCDEIFVTDGNGKIVFANPVSEHHHGIPLSEMVGKSVGELEERGIYYPAITPMVLKEKKKITIDQETVAGKKLVITATPVFGKDNNIEMVICNSRDVTALEDTKRSYHDIKKIVHQKLSIDKNGFVEEDPTEQLIFAQNSPFAELMQTSDRIAKTESVVLLQGETGTGKDLIARHIHSLSRRREKQYVKINCAALPQELLESELFGYKRGAFTGASPKGKIGQFSLADGGTILLDEIGEMPLSLQPKLLQVLEEQKFTPIGSHLVEKVNVRIIASTNKDLRAMIEKGRFREDLYYRICVLPITLPPLRERKDDIPLLIDHYLGLFNTKHQRKLKLSPKARACLINYDWPGNVRELKHLTELLSVTVISSIITPDLLPQHITSFTGIENATWPSGSQKQMLNKTLEVIERDLVIKSYRDLKSSYKVADHLGISQSSAIRKIRKYMTP